MGIRTTSTVSQSYFRKVASEWPVGPQHGSTSSSVYIWSSVKHEARRSVGEPPHDVDLHAV
eukprot:15439653-Alexandrium_andersonii.AAC.1